MRQKRSLRYSLLIAYIKRNKKPDSYDVFAVSYLRSKYIWGFVK